MGARTLSREADGTAITRSKSMKYLGAAALAVIGTVALTASASAAIVCNEEGDCWRVKERHTYPPKVQLRVYEDNWTIDKKKYRWREAGEGRGYWRGGTWITF
jgi:hypothetical protein